MSQIDKISINLSTFFVDHFFFNQQTFCYTRNYLKDLAHLTLSRSHYVIQSAPFVDTSLAEEISGANCPALTHSHRLKEVRGGRDV